MLSTDRPVSTKTSHFSDRFRLSCLLQRNFTEWCWQIPMLRKLIHTKKKLACITGAWAKRGEQGVSREAWNKCEAQDEGKRNSPTTEKQIRSRKKLLIPFVTQYQQALPGLKRILMGKWHLIQNQQRLREIFKKTPIISCHKGKSLIRNTSSPQKLIGPSLILDGSEVVWDILW